MEIYGFLLALQAYEDVSGSITASLDASVTLKHPTHQGSLRQLSVLMAALSLLEGMTGKPAQAYSATVTTHTAEALTIDPPTDAWTVAAPTRVAPVAAAIVPEPLPTTPLPEPMAIAPILPELPTVAGDRPVQTTNIVPSTGDAIDDPLPVVGTEQTQTIKGFPSSSTAAISSLAATHRSLPAALPAVESSTDRPAAPALPFPAAKPTATPAPLLLAQAQIVPDGTLPVNSQVAPGNCPACTVVNGGTVRGANLFHSFRAFSIPTGGEAYFNNAAQIQNILTRVTGNAISNIDGLIRANGTANLYLLNPNGIVFGPNASLNIGGSFVATTAGSLKFADGSEYSALAPQSPPLLAVNLAPGVQFSARAAGSIVSNAGNLAVPAGQSLTLLGGTTTSTGTLTAPGGTVQVLGDQVALQNNAQVDVSSPIGGGTVLIGGDYQGQGTVPNALQTYVAPTTTINADATANGNGGKVVVWAEDTTRFYGNISAQGGSQGGNGGFVEVSGARNLTFNGLVNTSAPFGSTGTLLLDPTNITVIAGSTPDPPNAADGIWAATEDSGNQTIGANAIVSLLDTNSLTLEATNAILFQNVDLAVNSPNTLTLRAGTINLLRASIEQTDRGNIVVEARDAINIDGTNDTTKPTIQYGTLNPDPIGLSYSRSGIFTIVPQGSKLQGGAIHIKTRALDVRGGALISASTEGLGSAGNVTINADVVNLSGVRKSLAYNDDINFSEGASNEHVNTTLNNLLIEASKTTKFQTPGGVLSEVLATASGNGGQIQITTNTLNVTEGSQTSAITYGLGRPGDVSIQARGSATFSGVANSNPTTTLTGTGQSLSVSNCGVTCVGTTSQIKISQFNVRVGETTLPPSGASASIRAGANVLSDSGGSVTIQTPLLRVSDGARITASTSAQGNAGNIKISGIDGKPANAVILSGGGPNAKFPSEARVDEFPGGISVLTQSQINSAGNPVTGNGGSIMIDTERLQASDGTVIQALTRGNGNAGTVTLTATESTSFDNSFVISEVQSTGVGKGGDVIITTGKLSLTNGAQVRASTSGRGNAGNITIAFSDRFTLRGTGSNFNDLNDTGIYAGTTAGSIGDGGSIRIEAQPGTRPPIIIRDGAKIAVNSDGSGKGGDIEITTPGRITLDNRAFLNATTISGKGGNITIDPDLVLLRRNSQISTSAGRNRGGGDGGNITITTGFLIAAPFENSDITANAYSGSGGNITINANAIFGFLNAPAGILNTPFSDIAASSTLGINGTIILNTLNLDPSQGLGELNLIPVDSSQLIAQSCATGKRQALNENKFALTGRSGIPASPEDVFRNGSVLTELGTPVTTETLASTPAAPASSTSPHNLVEAQDLIIDPNGKAHLVAQVSNTTPASFQQPRVTCPDGSSTQRPN